MTGMDMVQKIQRHPAVASTVPLETELQWPKFTMERGKLCVQVFFCHTRLNGKYLRVDPPRYGCKFSYPFEHVVLLEDYAYSNAEILQQPGWIDLAKEKRNERQQKVEELLHTIDQLLEQYDKQKAVPESVWEEYRQCLIQVIPTEQRGLYFPEERTV